MERCFSRYQNQEQLCRSVLALFAALFSQSESPNATARVAHEIDLYIRENYQTDITNQLLVAEIRFLFLRISARSSRHIRAFLRALFDGRAHGKGKAYDH